MLYFWKYFQIKGLHLVSIILAPTASITRSHSFFPWLSLMLVWDVIRVAQFPDCSGVMQCHTRHAASSARSSLVTATAGPLLLSPPRPQAQIRRATFRHSPTFTRPRSFLITHCGHNIVTMFLYLYEDNVNTCHYLSIVLHLLTHPWPGDLEGDSGGHRDRALHDLVLHL